MQLNSHPKQRSRRFVDAALIRSGERHMTFLRRYLVTFFITVVICSLLFHAFMGIEGRENPWYIGIYWTISTMTTLGLGDITFTQWPGQALTVITVISGLIMMLVLLPLLLIQFPPWVEARSAARVRRALPLDVEEHVILTHRDPTTELFIERIAKYGIGHVLIVPDLEEALRLTDQGWSVLFGALDHPETYRAARLDKAALMVASGPDVQNANAIFTARTVAPEVPILSTADREVSQEVLSIAGSTKVLLAAETMAHGLCRRVLGGDALTHEVADFGGILIAEANAARTPLVGKALGDEQVRDAMNVTILGIWDRGTFQVAGPETRIGPHTVLVVAGTRKQLEDYDARFGAYSAPAETVLILGGGRVGRATASILASHGVDYRLVERRADRCLGHRDVHGDAADSAVLEDAGLATASTVVITTHDDDTNVFLALYCRHQRADVQIVSRATFDKNVETLHRAGTDFVLSSASLGSDAIFEFLEGGDVTTISEGLHLFTVRFPRSLEGKSLAALDVLGRTGCMVVAFRDGEGARLALEESVRVPGDAEALVIGSRESGARFFEVFLG